jgi:hypothetical protein
MSDYDDLSGLYRAEDALWDAVYQDPGREYKAPRAVPLKYTGYTDDRYPGHKLPKKFRDDGDGAPDDPKPDLSRVRHQTTSAQREERRERARELLAAGKSLEEIAAELATSKETVRKYLQQGAWGKLL